MDNLYFDEIAMKEKLQNAISNVYKNDLRHEKNYWYKFFGNRNLKFYSSQTEANSQDKKPQFPCCILSLQSEPNTFWSNSTQIEEISNVDFTVEIYTQKIGNIDKEIAGSYLANIVLLGLRQVSGNITVSFNAPLINFDNNVYRRVIRGAFKYNNKTNTFYKGE